MARMPRRLILLLAGSALLLAPLLTVQLAMGAGRTHACSCVWPTPDEAFERADAVFSGRVTSVDEYFGPVAIRVDTVWKGSVTSTTSVSQYDGTSCSYGRFVEGEEYLVYAYERPHGTLNVWTCSGTMQLGGAQEALQLLGEGRAPEPGIVEPAPASRDAELTATRGPTDAGQAADSDGQAPDPVTTEAGSASVDSLRSLAWWTPLIAGIAAAALIIRRWAGHREPE